MGEGGSEDAGEHDDDMAVLLDAHEDTLDTLELTGEDSDRTACLVLELVYGVVGDGGLVGFHAVEEALHLAQWDDDGFAFVLTPAMAVVVYMSHVAFVEVSLLDGLEGAVGGPDHHEVLKRGHAQGYIRVFLVDGVGIAHGDEGLDIIAFEDCLDTEDLLHSAVEDAQGEPFFRLHKDGMKGLG